jgi:hypothetical protein
MATTLEQLEQRLAAVERQLAILTAAWGQPNGGTTAATQEGPVPSQPGGGKALLREAAARAFAAMGITGEPVPPAKLREMMAAGGVKPEENLFSRGIEEMRDE